MTFNPMLGREEHEFPAPDLRDQRVMVTGSRGSIGVKVVESLKAAGAEVRGFDIADGHDVTIPAKCDEVLGEFLPHYVIHLAAHKYATTAEDIPWEVGNLNVHGTRYICERAAHYGVKNVVVASTCKAVEPETVYGASKLIAERIALTAGFTVGRFFNVVDSAGNVFEIWRERTKLEQPLMVTPCRRYFVSGREAVNYMVHLLGQPPGRYAPWPGEPVLLTDMVKRFAPEGYPIREVPARRGDRLVEPLHGRHEAYELLDDRLMVITSPHDHPVPESDEAGPAVRLGGVRLALQP